MIKVGITGGIGSGKTTVCEIFERLGVPVYYADKQAKYLMETDKKLREAIRQLFGDEAFDSENNLNRAFIAGIVFKDEEKLLALNALVHPAVKADYDSWNSILERKEYPYSLKEAALLVESGSYKDLDKLIVVSAPLEDRIKRVMARDNVSEEQVKARIDAQLPDAEKVKLADYVIANNLIMELVPQVSKVHLDLLNAQ
ncbi:MAG: dephospho-CoA kinase [Chitinophagales bacterium]|jgi:dephospho-CoA kinase|nr:dephospho-CoA kinase [Chitinophagales bacterium]